MELSGTKYKEEIKKKWGIRFSSVTPWQARKA
jgi:hypothetical protein